MTDVAEMPRHRKALAVLGMCVACCAGPLVVILGGVTVAGFVSSLVFGIAGIAIAVVGVLAILAIRKR